MYQESLDIKQHIHLLGVSYVSNFLDRAGFTILEANTDQNHHYQLLARLNDKSFLIAIRTAHHPKLGILDACAMEKLLRESAKLNALPHFAGLTVVPAAGNDSLLDGSSEDQMLKVLFSGICAIRK
ncbi:MAG: hypothetical protein ACR2PB_08980 [Desulfocapsaceae bacterium]